MKRLNEFTFAEVGVPSPRGRARVGADNTSSVQRISPSLEFVGSPQLTNKFFSLPRRDSRDAFTLSEVEGIPSPRGRVRVGANKKAAFTLAEVLITLGVIGVVAAVALPALHANIQERVQREQLRTAKYKLTLATDKMKSLGLLNEQYPTTEAFVTELSKHLKLAKVCNNNNIQGCWPTDTFQIPTTSGYITKNVSSLKTGADISALGLGTKNTNTMGIVTADGASMILTYSPKCTPLDASKTYSWSTIDNKPETNATTNCISAVMDINGAKNPNRLGKDVRTWNSIMGYQKPGKQALSYKDCQSKKNQLGINECYKDNSGTRDDDYWGGAVKACHDLGLHLPSPQTLALIAGARYGRSDITPYTVITSVNYAKTNWGDQGSKSCEEIWRSQSWGASDQVICIDNGSNNSMGNVDSSAAVNLSGSFWSSSESSASSALDRTSNSYYSCWGQYSRYYQNEPLCLGD